MSKNSPLNSVATSPIPEEFDRLLRQGEVKDMLGLSDACLEVWRLKGLGPKFVKVGNRAVRYRLSDVRAYVAGLTAFNSTTEADRAATEAAAH